MKRRSVIGMMGRGLMAGLLPTGRDGHAAPVRLKTTDTLGTVLTHPAFAGYALRLMPWENERYDLSRPLSSVGMLMPWHRDFNTEDIVDALNAMIEQQALGEPVFHELYDETARVHDAQKAQTGLFFFRGRPGAPTAIIAPGGGFQYVGSLHEGFPIARAIAQRGFNAVVLKYRVGGGGRKAVEDLAAAVAWLHARQQTLKIDMQHYSLWGASAGARMAAYIGSHGVESFGVSGEYPRPSTVVMLYTGHSDVSDTEPPTFVAIGSDDAIASPRTMKRRIDTLRRMNVPVAFHVFPGVGHGFALGTGTRAQGWLDDAVSFWQQQLPHDGASH